MMEQIKSSRHNRDTGSQEPQKPVLNSGHWEPGEGTQGIDHRRELRLHPQSLRGFRQKGEEKLRPRNSRGLIKGQSVCLLQDVLRA